MKKKFLISMSGCFYIFIKSKIIEVPFGFGGFKGPIMSSKKVSI